jgi:hypothetical protein
MTNTSTPPMVKGTWRVKKRRMRLMVRRVAGELG